VNGWILAKYALALVGIGLVLAADNFGRRWLGYVGLAIIVAAFLLRFLQRRAAGRTIPPAAPPGA
jgi:hydrogenase/urease accessory protein HupE